VEALEIDDAYETELESELALIRDAVLLVAAGASRRVVVANLRHGRVILEPAAAMAADGAVMVEALATADPRRVDIAIRALPPGRRAILQPAWHVDPLPEPVTA
jgi:hypothetical protein